MLKYSHSSQQPIKQLRTPIFLLVAVFLTGCAAEQSYYKGLQLAENGDKVGALKQFSKAVELDSKSSLYRMAEIQTNEDLLKQHKLNFLQLLSDNKVDEAQLYLTNHLLLSSDSQQLLNQLLLKKTNQRHNVLVEEAKQLISTSDYEKAKIILRQVLAENPEYTVATLELTKLEQVLAQPTALDKAYKTPISIEFKDAPLKTVFEVISKTSGLNFVFDKDIKTDQKTSIYLKNSSIEAALRLTLITNQLSYRLLDSNSLLIYPNNQSKAKDFQTLTIKSFYLANAEAKTVAATLKTLLKTKDLVIDDKLNLIILRDTPEVVKLAEKLVALHDVADPEVMLEVEILEVNRTNVQNLGIQWPDKLSLSPIVANGATLSLADLIATVNDKRGRTIGVSSVNLAINANKVDGTGDVLANPRIRVRNRDKARILIGDRVPNITSTSTSTGFVSESINYVDVGLKFEVEPIISINGEVTMKVALEVSNIVSQITTKAGSAAYRIGTRSANTVLKLKDGENQVLAGLISSEERNSGNKVPGLGDLPIAGRLFGNQTDDNKRTEIVLSITPRILRNIVRPSVSLLEFDSGTESAPSLSVNSENVSNSDSKVKQVKPQLSNSINNSKTTKSLPPPLPALIENKSSESPVQEKSSAGSASYNLTWSAPSEITVGNTFTAQLKVQANTSLSNLPLIIGFTQDSLQVISVQEGDLFKADEIPSSFAHRIDPNGQILINSNRAKDLKNIKDADQGTIATVTFRALKPQTDRGAFVQVLNVAPVATNGTTLTVPLPAPLRIKINR